MEINKFKDHMAMLLKNAFDAAPSSRGIWGIGCSGHCYADYGSVDNSSYARNFTVPAGTNNSLGDTSNLFIFKNLSGLYLDQGYWPSN
jgi:hypothetical protein